MVTRLDASTRPRTSAVDESETNAVFRALADSTRRDILRRSIADEQSISELAERYEMSFAAVQKHVAVLDRCGLVVKERRGREQRVRARLDTIVRASTLLGEFEQLWRERVDRIDALLAESPAPSGPAPEPTPAPERTPAPSSAPEPQ